MISSLTKMTDEELFALFRKYDKDGNIAIYTYGIDGKNTDRGYYSNGKLAYISEFKILKDEAPIPNGKYIEYYKNGQIKVQGRYKDGKREGEFKTFLRNGKSAGSVFYKDGVITKSTLNDFMKNNASFSILTDINYNDNLHTVLTDEFPNMLLKQYFTFNQNGKLDGEIREYYEEGNIKTIVPFKNDVTDGNVTFYYENGNIEEKSLYKNGNRIYEEIYKDNEIIKNTFKNDKIIQQDIYSKNNILKAKKIPLDDGRMQIITYYENGNKQEQIFVIDNKMNGEAISYYENGVIKEKAYFVNDKQEKEHLFYDVKGNLTKTEIYKNGVKQ